jgi:hypothetical protein
VGILERWGGHALRQLGYETTTVENGRLPWTVYAEFFGKQTLWRLRCAWQLAKREVFGIGPSVEREREVG